MSYKNEAYEKALRAGEFNTLGLPLNMASEIKRYERAIIGLLHVADAMDPDNLTNREDAAAEREFAEESINNMVVSVGELHAKHKEERGLVAQARHDAMRGLEVAA